MSSGNRTAINLRAGDVIPGNGRRVVASVERNIENLGATLIRFTDGTWFHAGTFDCFWVERSTEKVAA